MTEKHLETSRKIRELIEKNDIMGIAEIYDKMTFDERCMFGNHCRQYRTFEYGYMIVSWRIREEMRQRAYIFYPQNKKAKSTCEIILRQNRQANLILVNKIVSESNFSAEEVIAATHLADYMLYARTLGDKFHLSEEESAIYNNQRISFFENLVCRLVERKEFEEAWRYAVTNYWDIKNSPDSAILAWRPVIENDMFEIAYIRRNTGGIKISKRMFDRLKKEISVFSKKRLFLNKWAKESGVNV